MSFLIILGIFFGALFGMAFLTKRRLGVLGLALGAGAIISSLWVGDLTPLVQRAGIVILQPPLESVVAAVLLLIPAAFLFISGPTYRGLRSRMLGAFLFALLAIFLMLDIFESAVIIDGLGQAVFTWLDEWKALGTTLILIIAIFEALGIRTPKPEKLPKH
jgi:hypothetical protein